MTVGQEEIQSYDQNGYARIKRLFDVRQLAEIERAYQEFLKVEAPKLSGRDINYVDKEKTIVNSIHRLHVNPEGFFSQLMRAPRIMAVASAFLRDDAVIRGSEMFAKPAGKGLPSPAHQDNYYWCLRPCAPRTALTIWVALDRVSVENGGVTYVKGSHKRGLVDHTDSFAPGSSQTVSDKRHLGDMEHVCLELEPGDALVHDSLTIHYSAANTSGRSRRGMTMQYQAAKASVDPDMLRHYETRLMEQVKKRTTT